MASGINLGILLASSFWLLLICSVQAEHVSRLWGTQAHGSGSQTHNGNKRVGFSQQETSSRQLGGSYPQNRFRQAAIAPDSAQSNSVQREPAVSSSYSQGLSNKDYTRTLSRPAKSDRASVSLAHQSSSGFAAASPPSSHTSSRQVNSPSTTRQRNTFGLSTSIASGKSVSSSSRSAKHQYQNPLSDARKPVSSKESTRPIQKSTLRTGQYLPKSPSRESYSFTSTSHQSAAQNEPYRSSTASKTPAYYGQSSARLFQGNSERGVSPAVGDVNPSQFVGDGRLSQQASVPLGISASAPGRRVFLQRTTLHKSQKPSPRVGDVATSYNPSHSPAEKPHRSTLFASNAAISSPSSYGQSVPVSTSRQQSHSLNALTSQRFSYKPSYTSIAEKQIPISVGSPQVSSGQGHLQSGRRGTSGKRLVAVVHKIPKHYGGFAIRRLQKE